MIAYRHFLIAFHGPVLAPATGQHTDKHTIETVGLDAALDKLTGTGKGVEERAEERGSIVLKIIPRVCS